MKRTLAVLLLLVGAALAGDPVKKPPDPPVDGCYLAGDTIVICCTNGRCTVY